MNTTTITGRLTADPELRFTPSGTAVATLRVANNDRDDHPVFVTVTAFDKLAQVVADHMVKGRRLAITGRLHFEQWETDGQKRSKLTVIAHQIDFLDAPPAEGNRQADSGDAPVTVHAEEEPF